MKRNVLRRVASFYPGFIQLPIKNIYPLSNEKGESLEWFLSKQFDALNIIDYRNKLHRSSKGKSLKVDSNYEPKKPQLTLEYFRDTAKTELSALMEVSTVGKEPFDNAKRVFYNTPFTEITIIQYYFDVEFSESFTTVPFDDQVYNEYFDKIVNYYILSSADFTIVPPVDLIVPLYLESYDLYFDNDVPQDEMRTVLLNKKDNYSDYINCKFDTNDFFTTLNRRLKIDENIVVSNLNVLLNSNSSQDTLFTEIITKARREIYKNKNYKYALLECFTFIEAFVGKYLIDCKLKAGVSKTKLDLYQEEVSISYKLNVELPIFLNLDESSRVIIGSADKIRKLRNDIIHSNKDNIVVTQAQAENAVNTAYNLYGLIKKNWKKD